MSARGAGGADDLWAVLMAGGTGTRFWPASRAARPKQFLPIAGDRPLLAATRARLEGLVPLERTLVVTAADQAALARECLPELPAANLVVEPAGRNTAPCVALAALELEERAPGSVQLVLPADHAIGDAAAFRASLAAAAEEARQGERLVTLGVRPTRPATGYGYIELGERLPDRGGLEVFAVARFVEKPPLEEAERYLAGGRHLWNAGVFAWSTRAILAALARHAPDILEPLRAARASGELERAYAAVGGLPIDVAVMERAEGARCLPVSYPWSDVGSWASLGELGALDEHGNASSGGGALLALEAAGCIAHGPAGSLTALIGVEDLVVVHAGRATLVCPRERVEEVKRLVERLEREHPEFL